MVNLPEAIYRFNAEAIKIPWQFFTDRKINSKIYGSMKDEEYSNQSWTKMNTAETITAPDFKPYYSIIIETAFNIPDFKIYSNAMIVETA